MTFPTLDAALPAILETLAATRPVLVQAPPGTGKTTGLPPRLLCAPWSEGQGLLLVAPRRLAARAAARFLAQGLGEPVGGTIGLRTRLETRVGPATRLTVVTTGVYLRLLQADPTLDGVAGVLLDECHERSLEADLALALTLDARALARPDLRLALLSATPQAADLGRLLPDLATVVVETPAHPVAVQYLPPPSGVPLLVHAARVIGHAVERHGGTVLVFLPGRGEIRRLQEELASLPAPVLALHGSTPAAAQDQALRPAPAGTARVVLATSIAETSLTIPDVTVVVDLGLARVPRFDPGRGLTTLATVPASLATAAQRAGRAGRTAPGVCLRLWAPQEDASRAAAPRPEILEADLAGLALEVAVWGTPAAELSWRTPPPEAALRQAQELLERLGALDGAGRPTAHGQQLARLPLPPRLGHMVLACPAKLRATACALAALLEEGEDLVRAEGDLRHALSAALGSSRPHPWRTVFHRLRHTLRLPATAAIHPEAAGELALLAYPERLAGQASDGSWRLSSGAKALWAAAHPPAGPWVVAPLVTGLSSRQMRIHAAAPVDRQAIDAVWGDRLTRQREVRLEGEQGRVVGEERLLADRLVLERRTLPPSAAERTGLLAAEIRRRGLDALGWSEASRQLLARVRLAAQLEPGAWPQWDETILLASLEAWFAPALAGCTSLAEALELDPAPSLTAWLATTHGPGARRRLDELLPPAVRTPAGTRRAIDYTAPGGPRLAVRLQEMFGTAHGPSVGGGRIPLTLELLSPAGRPLQVTQDLAAFWQGAYAQVRKEMRGRYPKHHWPEDPAATPATASSLKRTVSLRNS